MITMYKATYSVMSKDHSEFIDFTIESESVGKLKILADKISKLFSDDKYSIRCISTNVKTFDI